MALNKNIKYVNQITQDEHDDTANVEVKKSGEYGWDADNLEWKRIAVDSTGNLNVNATLDTTGLATSAIQTDGSQKTQVVDSGGVNVDFATQTTLNSIDGNINSIDGKLDSLATDDSVQAVEAKIDASNVLLSGIAGFTVTGFDYIGATYPNTSTEVYTYKTGGAGGTTVATITVVYSDAVTKQIITSVTKT